MARLWERVNGDGHSSVSGAVVRFALAGLVALIVVGALAVTVLRHAGVDQAKREASELARVVGDGLVGPWLPFGIAKRDPKAIAQLDKNIRANVLKSPVVRVKLWAPDGTILYSDERRLIGQRFALEEEEREVARNHDVEAEVSDLTAPENRYETKFGKLLEVYHGIRGPDGSRYLFEIYERYSSISSNAERLWVAFLPALIGGLLVLWLIQVPLAASLARRLRRTQIEREDALKRAVVASQTERQRIARDLHDGPVQDLAGVSYALTAARAQVDPKGATPAAKLIDGAAADARRSIRDLRTLLVELYPRRLEQEGLPAALADLASTLEARSIEVDLDAPADWAAGRDADRVLFRSAQEAIRNVLEHASASHVTIALQRSNGDARLVIRDDGRGFDPDGPAPPKDDQHYGLTVLHDLARDASGSVQVTSQPGAGTEVAVEVPAT